MKRSIEGPCRGFSDFLGASSAAKAERGASACRVDANCNKQGRGQISKQSPVQYNCTSRARVVRREDGGAEGA